MAYIPKQWVCGEDITDTDLNHMELGIKSASEKNDATDALETQVDLLEARVDNIVAPSGTAPNPDEIIDARVGADGTQYDSLGNAIRGQVSDLKSDLNGLNSGLEQSIIEYYAQKVRKYIYSTGSTEDSTNWESYIFDLTNIAAITFVESYTNDASYLQVAFYSSMDTFTSATFVGGKAFGAIGKVSSSAISKPDGAISCIVTNRKTSGTDIVIQGILKGTISDIHSEISDIYEAVGSPVNVVWEAGSISGASGADMDLPRCRTQGYIPAKDFYSYVNFEEYRTILFAYDEEKNFLGRCSDGFSAHYYTKPEALAIYPTAKYFRIVMELADLNIAKKTQIFRNKASQEAYLSYRYINQSGYPYKGKRISVNDNYCKYIVLPYGSIAQDAVDSENYFISCDTNGTLRVDSIETGDVVMMIDLDEKATIKPHCNSAVWGNKYVDTDEFPLLYINAYNAEGLPNGTCYVHRIKDNNGVPTTPTELIQTISIGFANEEPWTSGNDIRPYGNFFVDAESGFLWAYTLKDDIQATRFFKFALPSIATSAVTLAKADILEQFDVPYLPYIQGNTYKNGKAYVLSGFGVSGTPGMLNVINLFTKEVESQVNLNDIGLAIEPEFINIRERNIILGQSYAYKFEF